MDEDQLSEGDLFYHQHLMNIKEEILISSDEFENADYIDINDENASTVTSNPSIQNENESGELQQIHNEENDEISDATTRDSIDDKTSIRQNVLEVTVTNDKLHDQDVLDSSTLDQSVNKNTDHSLQIPGRKKRFSSKNMLDQYCFNCNISVKNRWGHKKLQKCKKCKTSLQYRCITCNKGYPIRSTAYIHVKNKCHSAQIFHCSVCYYISTNQENLADHVKSKHAILQCLKCNEKCQSCQMMKHLLYECKADSSLNENAISDLSLNGIKAFRRKQKNCDVDHFMELQCNTCNKIVEKDKTCLERCKDCKSRLQYQCSICCKQFNRYMGAYNHIRICSKPPEYFCAECDYNTSFKANLMIHIDFKHLAQKCKVCEAMYENGQSLSKHEKYECKLNPQYRGTKRKEDKGLRERPKKIKRIKQINKKPKKRKKIDPELLKFYCSKCNVISECHSTKLTPCRTCTNIQLFHCVRCNSANFETFDKGYKHVKRSYCLIPYRCRRCGFQASNNEELLQHRLQQHTVTRVECPDCGDIVKEVVFKKHSRLCARPAMYGCTICPDVFKHIRKLKRHKNTVHGEQMVDNYCLCIKCEKKLLTKNLNKHLKKWCPNSKRNCNEHDVSHGDKAGHNDNLWNDDDDDDVICLDDLQG